MKPKMRATNPIAIIVFAILLATTVTANNVVISQVLYDPSGTESGGEAVELYNPTTDEINISGWTLMTESSTADATIPAGTYLASGSKYLIADEGWNTSKDNTSWREADYKEAISMTNTDAGVALVDTNSAIIDAVGWGNPAGINTGLFEGTPAQHVTEGTALVRDGDTNDNLVDFEQAVPDFGDGTNELPTGEGDLLELTVNVSNAVPTIVAVSIEDDLSDSGIQNVPMPGETRLVKINVSVSDEDGASDIQSITIKSEEFEEFSLTKQSSENNTARYTGTYELPYWATPGEHNLTLNVSDYGTSNTTTVPIQVVGVASIGIDSTAISFAEAKLGSRAISQGDTSFGTALPTVRNAGNLPIDIGIAGTDLTDGENTIPVNNLEFSLDNSFTGELSGVVGTETSLISLGLTPGLESSIPLAFRLYIPPGTPNGAYQGEITIIGIGV